MGYLRWCNAIIIVLGLLGCGDGPQRLSESDTAKKEDTIPTFYLTIPAESDSSLVLQRTMAIRIGPYYRYQDSIKVPKYAAATLSYNGLTYPIKMRLKGMFPEHYDDPDKCSYKIKLTKDGVFRGINRFAIQHPKVRGYLNEWYFHRLLAFYGLIALQYDFVKMNINGNDHGIYALEENMHYLLIERNGYPNGPILRFTIEDPPTTRFLFREIELYKGSLVRKDIDQLLYFEDARKALIEWRDGNRLLSEVFDIDQMAKFFALVELTGHHHATHLSNLKFYYNPETQKILPVPYDNTTIWTLENEDILAYSKELGKEVLQRPEIPFRNSAFYEHLFKNEEFYRAYIGHLQAIAQPEFLDEFFMKYERKGDHMEKVIQTNYPEYSFTQKETMYANQQLITKQLDSLGAVSVQRVSESSNDIEVKLKNPNPLALEITMIRSGEQEALLSYPVLIQPNVLMDSLKTPRLQQLIMPLNGNIQSDPIEIGYKVLGAEQPLFWVALSN